MNKHFSRMAVLLCLLCTMGNTWAARTAPLVDKAVAWDASGTRTPEQTRGYILRAAAVFNPELTYKIESDNPGALQLELNKENKHFVSVMFTYDHAGFQTSYVTSKNLNYRETDGARIIHPAYMVWIEDLIKAAKIAYTMQLDANGGATNPDVVSQITLRSTEGKDIVKFQKADETVACGKFADLGTVMHAAEAAPAAVEKDQADKAAQTPERKAGPQPSLPPSTLQLVVAAGKPLRIRGTSSIVMEKSVGSVVADTVVDAIFMSALSAPKRAEYAGNLSASAGSGADTELVSCGPTVFQFTPQAGRQYSVEYSVSHAESRKGTCLQKVFDVTEADKRVPVAAEQGDVCKK